MTIFTDPSFLAALSAFGVAVIVVAGAMTVEHLNRHRRAHR